MIRYINSDKHGSAGPVQVTGTGMCRVRVCSFGPATRKNPCLSVSLYTLAKVAIPNNHIGDFVTHKSSRVDF